MVAIVTGSSSGIGYEVCQQLRDKGYTVYGLSRRGLAPEGVTPMKADVADPDALRSVIDEIARREVVIAYEICFLLWGKILSLSLLFQDAGIIPRSISRIAYRILRCIAECRVYLTEIVCASVCSRKVKVGISHLIAVGIISEGAFIGISAENLRLIENSRELAHPQRHPASRSDLQKGRITISKLKKPPESSRPGGSLFIQLSNSSR